MIRISAKIGFLWADLPHPARVRAAARAGFDAVECHFPFDTPAAEMAAALAATGLPLISLNTRPGDLSAGEFGLAALPGREAEARAAIDEAAAYARATGARAIHVMAGRAPGPAAQAAFAANLGHALRAAPQAVILVEPLNRRDVPGYLMHTVEEAARLVRTVGNPRLKILFDCYHQQIEGGDLTARFRAHAGLIGHVQFAAVPGRAEPDTGELALDRLIPALAAAGHSGHFGAEYRPAAGIDAGLGWLPAFRAAWRT